MLGGRRGEGSGEQIRALCQVALEGLKKGR